MKKLSKLLILMTTMIACLGLFSITVHAYYFPTNQVLPSDLTSGVEEFTKVGLSVLESDRTRRYTMYKGNKLHDKDVVVYKTNIQDFYPSRGKNATISLTKTESKTFSVSEEVSASLGVSTGAEAFGCEATVSVEVSASLGVESSIGEGYSETVTYTLTPEFNEEGGYYIAVNGLVRKYRFVEEKYYPEEFHYKRQWYTLWIWNKKIVDKPARWEETGKVYETYYIENYYYTLECVNILEG